MQLAERDGGRLARQRSSVEKLANAPFEVRVVEAGEVERFAEQALRDVERVGAGSASSRRGSVRRSRHGRGRKPEGKT